ncbi:hypothetical protein GCM10027449_05890 [Sinomonas notoginsengisoli]|uniref:hypothetical protein n=1 Tax=Sinomonas notoginsengisoli TaxID=1457311 RepID=UPI001F2CF483|nr:hypothetical protein [Sinomonas notoginsengisoli]
MATNTGAGNEKEASSTGTAGENRPGGQEITFTVPQVPAMAELMEPKRLLWFGGLAAAGVIGVLEWPVVAAVGIGSYVAERFAESNRRAAGR